MNDHQMISYQHRFHKALDYIESHLEEKLSLAQLSRVAHLSKYHFHRQFAALFGLNIFMYIKLSRVKRASYQLAFRHEIKVIDIALANGYQSSEAFSRAFKVAVGQSPSNFRKNPNWEAWHEKHQLIKNLRNNRMERKHQSFKVKTMMFNEIKVACLEHRGAPEKLGNTIRQFINWRKDNRLPPSKGRTFNLVFDEPDTTKAEDYRFDLCAAVTSNIAKNDYGVINKNIPGGRCAVLRHIGTDDNIGVVVSYLYSDWLEQSGEALRDFPLFFERVSFFPDVAECEMVTDVYLPIE